MDSYQRERFVTATPVAVRNAIDVVMTTTWPNRSRLVAECAGTVTFAVDVADSDGEVWLSWRVTAQGAGCLVQLILDEVDAGPEPHDELDQILSMLSQQVGERV